MKFDLEHWVPLFFLCVVNKPPHEHDLCRWPRLDPLIVGVCAGVRASVCAGQVGAFSQLDARRPSPNPNPRPSQSQLPAITIQVRSRGKATDTAAHTCELSLPAVPWALPKTHATTPPKPHSSPIPYAMYDIPYTIPISHPRVRSARLLAIDKRQYPIPNTNTQAKCNSKSMLLVAASSQKGFVVGGDRAKNGFATGIRF